MDPYRLLGVKKSASDEEIKRAFRDQAKRWHPDRNPGDPEAERRFKELSEAYALLQDPAERSLLDSGRRGPSGPVLEPDFEPGNYGLGDLVGDIFGPRPDPEAFPDLEEGGQQIRVRVPGHVLAHGGTVKVPVSGETLRVRVPAGSREGSRLRLPGSGPHGGDLILILQG